MEISMSTLKGQFLIAMPHLLDPFFYKSLAVMVEHNADAATGVVINRLYQKISAKMIFDELKINYIPSLGKLPVYMGGPVNNTQVLILHGPPLKWIGSVQITATLALTQTMDIIHAIAKGSGPERFQIILGQAGWGAGQLENEFKINYWLNTPISDEIIFDTPVNQRWDIATQLTGINPSLMSSMVGHA